MNRNTQTRQQTIDWERHAERALFWGILLIVAAVFHNALGLAATAAPIPVAGIVREFTPPSPPSAAREELARVVVRDGSAAAPCSCTEPRSLR